MSYAALVLRTGLEAVRSLVDTSLGASLAGVRDLALIDHRLLAQQWRIVEDGVSLARIQTENPFKDLDTPDDPDYSRYVMDALSRFATDFEYADGARRIEIRDALLVAHRACVTGVGAAEGEIPIGNIVQDLGRITTPSLDDL